MSDTDTVIPTVEFHLKMMKSSFKVPLELIKKNSKVITKLIERQNQTLLLNLNKLITSSIPNKLESMGKIISNYEKFHSELQQLINKHNDYVDRIQYRYAKVQEFAKLREEQQEHGELTSGLASWYREQVELMVCNYLVRTGNVEVGYKLIQKNQFEKLIDFDIIKEGLHIFNEIKENKNLNILIEWCNQNKKNLSKLHNGVNLEFETYFQKFIELLKEEKLFESIKLAKDYLISKTSNEFTVNLKNDLNLQDIYNQPDVELRETEENDYIEKLISATRLLLFNSLNLTKFIPLENNSTLNIYDPLTNAPNVVNDQLISKCLALYSPQKWSKLANYFLYNFNQIYGLNQNIEFMIMLSTGISSLKTKSCQQCNTDSDTGFEEFLSTNDNLLIKNLNNCPVCSLELNKISQNLPYSHQIVSNIFNNPVMLPNGNIYQLNKLIKFNENLISHEWQSTTTQNEYTHKNNTVLLFSEKLSVSIYSDEMEVNIDNEVFKENFIKNDTEEYDFEDEVLSGDVIFEDLKYLNKFNLKDPLTGEVFNSKNLTKVFPT